ncbi:MAG: hypothetical protein M9894_05625 [Planctomycetes bacterium]|nr:hypothetical protein [Planctomycetota bacterium]
MNPQNPHTTTSSSATAASAPVVPSTGPLDLLAPTAIDTSPALLKRISWGAIFAGAVVASVLQIWFNLLGLAIGLAAFDPLADQAFGFGTVIWVLLTSVISLFCGGWLAGRLTGSPTKLDRALHGVVTWGVAMIFGLWIVTAGVTRALAGTAAFASDIAGAVAPAALQQLDQAQLPPEIEQDLQTLQADPQLRDAVITALAGETTPGQRAAVIDQLAARTGMSREEAESSFVRWEQQATLLQYRVAGATERATTALSGVAFLGVVSMFLGLGAAALGGSVSYPDRPRGRTGFERGGDVIVPRT